MSEICMSEMNVAKTILLLEIKETESTLLNKQAVWDAFQPQSVKNHPSLQLIGWVETCLTCRCSLLSPPPFSQRSGLEGHVAALGLLCTRGHCWRERGRQPAFNNPCLLFFLCTSLRARRRQEASLCRCASDLH